MSRDSLDELARRLWASGANERAPEALRARILARAGGRSLESAERVARTRLSKTWLWLAAAFGLFALALALGVRANLQREAPTIGAEAPSRGFRPARAPLANGDARSDSPAAPPRRKPTGPTETAPAGPIDSPRRGVSRPAASRLAATSPASAEAREPPTLAEEVRMLQEARALMRAGDHAGALRALDGYVRTARGSNLSSEASLLRMEALAGSGRGAEASLLARRFVDQNPNSSLVDRARSFLTPESAAP